MSPVLGPRRRRVCDCLGITTCTDAVHMARHRCVSWDSWDADGRPMSPALRLRRRRVCDLHELSCLTRDGRHPLSGELVAALVCDGHDGDPGASCRLMFLSCSSFHWKCIPNGTQVYMLQVLWLYGNQQTGFRKPTQALFSVLVTLSR